jgi:hypothetical protein
MRVFLGLCAVALGVAGCASKPKVAKYDEFAPSNIVVKLRRAPGASSSHASEPSALAYVNARREEAGLPAIAADRGVAAAAADHARYVLLNQAGTHDEIDGRPGFTGADVLSRVRRHTQASSASEVLASIGGAQPDEAPIEHIFASPYHRGALLFDWARAGEGAAVGYRSVTVVDFADIAPSLADNELIAWPYDGQTQVPVAWINNEQPDPMGNDSAYRGQPLGYPITLSGGPNAHIELQSFDLRDAQGKRVPCRIAPLTAADVRRNTAICTPYEALRSGVRYSVHAQGILTQLTVKARFDLEWAFTTASGVMRATSQ